MGFCMTSPVAVSLAIPILLEKKGRVFRLPLLAKRSAFSRKNCLFSGKKISKRFKSVTCSSTSTWEKSGLIVRSRLRPDPSPILASPPKPPKRSRFVVPSSTTLFVVPVLYSWKAEFQLKRTVK